jgi:hypothetical protein
MLVTLGAVAIAWNFFDYLCLQHSGITTPATILKIEQEHGRNASCHVTVRYVTAAGKEVTLRREVRFEFADRFKTGDVVTVAYLPNHAWIGRIPNWDLDGREWVMLLFMLPFIPIFFFCLRGLLRWFQPLRDQIRWETTAGSSAVFVSGTEMGACSTAFPEAHQGQLVIQPSVVGSHEKPSRVMWKRVLVRAGFLYGGAIPHDFTYPEVADLFGVDPTSGSLGILLERGKSGPRIWMREGEADQAAYGDCINGPWTLTPNQPVPEALRRRKGVTRLLRFFMLPVIVPTAVMMFLVSPLIKLEARRRQKSIAQAAKALSSAVKQP